MTSRSGWKLLVVLGVIGFAAWYTFPLQSRISLGLDLQGGMHLVLKVDTSHLPPEARDKDVTAIAVEIIRNRIDQFGVREPLIQRQGADHIVVQLPGITDRDRAIKLIGQTALLKFQLVSESQRLIQQALDGTVPAGYELSEDDKGSPLLLETEGALTGGILSDAWVEAGEMGLPEVSFRLNKEGAKAFGRLTGTNINRRLAIVLDGKVQSAPVIQSRITDAGRITGRFTREEAHDLAIVLRAGALPAPIVLEEERTVGPTLGRDSIRAGLMASAAGALLVVVFMIGYYWLAGIIAVVALTLNLLIIFGCLGYLHATLTLPGIAGIMLTLGMAVDANVLINERIRDELRGGRPLSLAIDAGYHKAFSAIFDSNITTIISALFLYWFGTGSIRGFATTLITGLVASMFTAIFVTRILFDTLLNMGWLKKLSMLHLIRETKIDFIGKRHIAYALTGILTIAGAVAFVHRGPQRYGLDFSGGLLQQYRFSHAITADELRTTLNKVGLGHAVIQEFGTPTEWLIRTSDDTDAAIQQTTATTREAVTADFGQAAAPQLERFERVGPTVSHALRQKAWLAIAWSMVGIMLYVAFRFRNMEFGVAGVISLIHDVVMAGGILCLIGRPIDLLIIVAFLTIAGYSINDTIVVYDRVRENLRLYRKMGLTEVINLSINQMLGRTILTTLTVILEVLALYFFGGEVLHDFAFCLLIGFISGVYSTVYIASPLVITWRRFTTKAA